MILLQNILSFSADENGSTKYQAQIHDRTVDGETKIIEEAEAGQMLHQQIATKYNDGKSSVGRLVFLHNKNATQMAVKKYSESGLRNGQNRKSSIFGWWRELFLDFAAAEKSEYYCSGRNHAYKR